MNTLNSEGHKLEPFGTPFSESAPYASNITQFYPLMSIIQIPGKKLAGSEIYPIRWNLSNEQFMGWTVDSLA